MAMLQITYTVGGTKSIFELSNNSNRDQCKFIEDFDIQEDDEIEINNNSDDIYHHLNLYQKIDNLYIFSICSSVGVGEFASLDYNYFLIWNKDTNIYCYVQNEVKTNKVVDEFNNIDLPDNLFTGLFRKSPDYYLDTADGREPFINLIKLPKQAYKSIIKEKTEGYHPITGEKYSYKYVELDPIKRTK